MNRTIHPWRQGRTAVPLLAALAAVAAFALAGPAQAATASAASAASAPAKAHGHKKAATAKPARVKQIDINSASREQLKTLPGVGDAEADKIIAGRPYLTKAELVSRKVLPTGPYLSIKRLIIAKPKLKPNGQPELPAKSG